MLKSRCLSLLLIAALTSADLPLPSYIKACARNDPNLDACAVEHGTAAISELVKGDRKYGIPPLDPMEIPEVELRDSNLVLKLKNVTVHGLKDIELKRISYDFKNEKADYEFYFPRLVMLGQYQIDGRILLLPITGKGDINVTLERVTDKNHAILKIVQRNDKEYLEFRNVSTQLEPQRVHFLLTNLFNGNKLLGEEMNRVLNRDWKDAFRDLGSPIIETTNKIVQSLSDKFAKDIPLEAWFPEKS